MKPSVSASIILSCVCCIALFSALLGFGDVLSSEKLEYNLLGGMVCSMIFFFSLVVVGSIEHHLQKETTWLEGWLFSFEVLVNSLC